jgi:hypothetical protein
MAEKRNKGTRGMERPGRKMPAMGSERGFVTHENTPLGSGNLKDHADAMRYDNPRGYLGLNGFQFNKKLDDRDDCRHQTRHHMEIGESLVRGGMPLTPGGTTPQGRGEPQWEIEQKKPYDIPSHRPKVD